MNNSAENTAHRPFRYNHRVWRTCRNCGTSWLIWDEDRVDNDVWQFNAGKALVHCYKCERDSDVT